MHLNDIISIANYSDGVLYVLAILLVLALGVVLDRAWYLRRTIMGGARLVRRVAAHPHLYHAELTALAHQAANLPEASLIETALHHGPEADRATLEAHLDEAIQLTMPMLDRRLWLLDTIITLAPLLGLFGTILGMFRAFSVLAQPGNAPTAVTGGVANALITTAAGIFVAMAGLLAYNGLNNLVRQVVMQLDTVEILLLNRVGAARKLPAHPAQPAPARPQPAYTR